MKKLLAIIITLTALFDSMVALSEDRQLEPHNLTTKDGLASNYVYDILQNQSGLIWIGGTGGLSIFDCYHVRHFANLPHGKDGHTMTPAVTSLSLDNEHQLLWIKTLNYMFFCHDLRKGLFVDYTGRGDQQRTFREMVMGPKNIIWLYQDVNGVRRVQYDGSVFHTTDYTKETHQLPFAEARQLCPTADDGAWITGDGGIAFIRPNGKSTIVASGFKIRRCVETDDGHYLFFTSENEVLVGNGDGRIERTIAIPYNLGKIHRVTGSLPDGHRAHVFTNAGTLCVDLERKTIERSSWPDLTEGLNYGTFNGRHVVIDRLGKLTILNTKGQLLVSQQLLSPEAARVLAGRSFHTAADHQGNIYITTNGNGLFVYDSQTGNLRHHLSTDANPIIPINDLQNVMVDRDNNIWLSTNGAGITFLIPVNAASGHYLQPSTKESGDIANMVSGIFHLDSEKVYVSTQDGSLYAFNPQTKFFQYLKTYDSPILSYLVDSRGHHWVGTSRAGLYIDNVHYQKQEGQHCIEFVSCDKMAEDDKGRIWIAARNYGLKMLSVASEYGDSLVFSSFLDSNAGERTILDMTLDKASGHLWIATMGGLFMVDTHQNTITKNNIRSYTPINSPLPSYDIISLYAGKKELWCGIHGGGLVYCRLSDDGTRITSCEQLTVTQGLPSNNVNVILHDSQSNVWAGTESGLAFIDKRTNNVNTVSFSRRVADNYFISSCSMLMPDGHLLLGTNGGLLEVTPRLDTSPVNTVRHPILVNDLHIGGKSIFSDLPDTLNRESFINKAAVQLLHDQNNLTIFFSTLQPAKVNATIYQYYLEGYDDTWLPPTSNPQADYQQLEPGTYVFHMKAFVDNEWTEGQPLTIAILPPWHKTWWAYLIYLCLFVILGFYIFRQLRVVYQLRQHVKMERQRAEMERQLTDYKIRFFTNISHEFRTPLTIIRGMMERLKQLNQQGNMKQPLDTMQHSVERMLRLINQLLEFRKMQQGKLSLALREADIVAHIQNIYMDFHETAEERDIHYDFRAQMRSLRIPFDVSYIDKIVYNLISNAFKYTRRKGEVIVELKKTDADELQIIVKDNGIGVPEELRPHLFDRYMESNRVVKDSLGIGLTLTAELVRTHHGSISYDLREDDTSGSIFTVTLPASRSAYSDDEFAPQKTLDVEEENMERKGFEQVYREMQANPLNEDVTVMVVEDDGDVASYIDQTLAPYFKVITAGNGEEALKLLEEAEQKPELIVSDVMMPQMDGFQLTARLRKDEQWRHMPIILLTALTDQDKYLKGITQGADLYLSKPFSPSVLVAHALQLVNQRGKVRKQATAEKEKRQAELPQVAISDIRDKNFLRQVDDIISRHLSDENLSVETLTDGLGIGRSKLFEKMKALMDMTPRDYILKRRMDYAVELLKDGNLGISEIAYKTGFGHPPYFTRVFKKYYGVTPSEYIKGTPE